MSKELVERLRKHASVIGPYNLQLKAVLIEAADVLEQIAKANESAAQTSDSPMRVVSGGDTISASRSVAAPPVQSAASGMPEDDGLTFGAFRRANAARCVKWHPSGIQSWSPSDWLTAVAGELGELASLLKMRNRERDGLPGNKFSPTQKQIADELADVVTYLDLLAEALGVDLGRAVTEKFNEVSQRVGFPDRITPENALRTYAHGLEARLERAETNYYELIYAVSNKHPNESRHQTALRYIMERESRCSGPQAARGADREGREG